MGNFNFKIPDKLHKKFKLYSIEKGEDMKDILVKLIKSEVGDYNGK